MSDEFLQKCPLLNSKAQLYSPIFPFAKMNRFFFILKTTDLDVNTIIKMLIDSSSSNHSYLKLLNDRIDKLSQNAILEIRNLINDLKIYFIGPLPVNESLIKPWSVVGKYVRRCVIIYEKMIFDDLVVLCKQARFQFEHLSHWLAKSRQTVSGEQQPQQLAEDEIKMMINSNVNNVGHNYAPYDEDTSGGSPSNSEHFLNDESNLTITSEFINRSTNVDCSHMDLESLETKLSYQIRPNIKALTSTVSHRRHQQQYSNHFQSKSSSEAILKQEERFVKEKIQESKESISIFLSIFTVIKSMCF